MAPFPIFNFQPELDLEPRRASPDQITQTITHESTTYITTIALGTATAVTSNPAPATNLLTTAILASPTQVQTVETTQSTLPASPDPSSPNTGVVIGAVLGSILGVLVLITVLYKCCIDNRSAAWIPTISRSYDSDSDSESEPSSRSTRTQRRVHRRGGGGDGFGSDNHRGNRVRRPRRARTRRSRHRHENRSRSGSRGDGSERGWNTERYKSRSRRGSGMNNSDGLLGWFLVPRTTSGYSYTERKNGRESWAGGGRGTADD